MSDLDLMHPETILERLRRLSLLADLDPARRLDFKVDSSPDAVLRRLRQQSALRSACRRFGGGG